MKDFNDIWLPAHNMIRSARLILNQRLAPLNLSSAEGNILFHLAVHGPEMGQEEIVNHLDVSKPAISRTISSLKDKGFITRQRDPSDKRAYMIRLTEKAIEINTSVTQAYTEMFSIVMKEISQKEMKHFINVFEQISKNLVEYQTLHLK